jgi:hypothetical protein
MMDGYLLLVVFHVAVIAPTLMFVGFSRAATPDWLYNVLFGVGLLVFAYHGYKAVTRLVARSPVVWVNLIHTLIVAPLLIWIGFHGKKTGRPAYDMLLMTAFAVAGFHLYKAVVISQTFLGKESI